MAEKNQPKCMTEGCMKEAVVYCTVCEQLFCETHNEIHEGFLKISNKTHRMISSDEYDTNVKGDSQYCNRHDKSQLLLACWHCYQPLCMKCMDDVTDRNRCTTYEQAGGRHDTRSIEQVSQKIDCELKELLSEMRVNQMRHSDDLKMRRKHYDEEMDRCRDELDRLDKKVQELKKTVEEFEENTRRTIVESMDEKTKLLQKQEKQYKDEERSCNEIRGRVYKFMNKNKELIVKNHHQMKDELHAQITITEQVLMELKEEPPIPKSPFLIVSDKPMLLPIALKESAPGMGTPTVSITRLALRETRKTQQPVFCVQFSETGNLLYSGEQNVSGLDFAPNIPSNSSLWNRSMYLQNNNIYILQFHTRSATHHLHNINLLHRSVIQDVAEFKSDKVEKLAANDDHIVISDHNSNSLKVYSTKRFTYLFDIKHDSIKIPWAIELLADTLIVGDCQENQVVNMTISEKPDINWICTGVAGPSAIVIDENRRMVLAASHMNRQIYVLSYQGVKLSTIAIPECPEFIWDITVYNNQLAVAGANVNVKIYGMETK